MWNNLACTSYDVCSTRQITEAHKRHLQQLANSKSSIDTKLPWQPSHSLSKCANKYTNTRNQKIQHDNQVLLTKMMSIENKNGLNPNRSASHIHSIANYQRRQNQETILTENNKIIQRIETATKKSVYGKQVWIPESKKCEQYRTNILKSKQKVQGLDYTSMTKLNYPNEKFVIRKIQSATQNNRFRNSDENRNNTEEDVEFRL